MMQSIEDVQIEREEDHDDNSYEIENDVVYTTLQTGDDSSLLDEEDFFLKKASSNKSDFDKSSKVQGDDSNNICNSNSNSDHTDDDDDDDGDDDDGLLEPFPERKYTNIDHDRRPKEIGIDGEEEEDDILRPGDHIYVWKSFGMLGMSTYQKHGIVLHVDPEDDTNVSIVTFYHKNKKYQPPNRMNFFQRNASERSNSAAGAGAGGSFHEYSDDGNINDKEASLLQRSSNQNEGHSISSFSNNNTTHNSQNQKFTNTVRTESIYSFAANSRGGIRKVKYNATLAKRLLSRGGTVTSCSADEPALTIARLQYLLEEQGRMPEFHMMAANGECAAVWCRMGRWCTLQGSSILHILFVGQAGGAAVGGVVATNLMLWAPMPGFWGSVGYIWFVPATVAYPLLVPVLIGFGLASLVPLEALRRFRKKWAQISTEMNKAFWANTDADIRECYFSSTVSADDDWTNKFFGGLGDKMKTNREDKQGGDASEEDKGNYMPLGGGAAAAGTGGDDVDGSFDSSDDVDEDEIMNRISAEYGLAAAGKSSQQDFEQEWNQDGASSLANDKWQNMFGRKKESKISTSDFYDNGDEDTKRPLTDDSTCRELL